MNQRPQAIFSWALALFFGGCAASSTPSSDPAAPRVSSPTDEPAAGARFVENTAQTAQRAGAGPLQLIRFGAARVGDSIDGFVFVPEARCALVYARGGARIEDLDLHVFGDDGTQFGADEAPDDLPTLLLCPPQSVRLYVSARVAQGEGVVALAMHDLPRQRSETVARAVGARNFAQKPKAIYEAWPGLGAKIAQHRTALGGEWTDLRRVALPVDARVPTTLSAVIPQNRCLDVLVVPDEGVAQVDVLALDSEGRIFARAQELGSERYLVLCSPTSDTPVSVVLRPHAGQGMAAVVLSATKAAADALHLAKGVVRYNAGDVLHASPLPKDSPPPFLRQSLHAYVGSRSSAPVSSRGCARVDLIHDEHLRGAELWFWDEAGRLLADSEVPDLSPLFVCHKGPLRMDASAAERDGLLSTQWVVLHLPQKVEERLMENPLAASRLLQILELSSDRARFGSLEQVERLVLSPTSLHKKTVDLPAGTCESIFIASGPDAAGLEARVFDPEANVELDMARGSHAVSVRACAPPQRAQSIQVEVRSLYRESTALVAWMKYPVQK